MAHKLVDCLKLGHFDYLDLAAIPCGRHGLGLLDHDLLTVDLVELAIGETQVFLFLALTEREARTHRVDRRKREREGGRRTDGGKYHLNGRLAIYIDIAQPLTGEVAHISSCAGHYLLQQPLGAELEDFIGYVNAVDGVFVTVKTTGRRLVGGSLIITLVCAKNTIGAVA